MPKGLNNWRFIDVKRFLSDHNFNLNHIEGSHYIYKGITNKMIHQVCVPFHGNKSLHPKTMKSIINQSGIDKNEWFNNH